MSARRSFVRSRISPRRLGDEALGREIAALRVVLERAADRFEALIAERDRRAAGGLALTEAGLAALAATEAAA